jgi:hypothetical protein
LIQGFNVNATVFLELSGKQKKIIIRCIPQTRGYTVFNGSKTLLLDEQHDVAVGGLGAREAAA